MTKKKNILEFIAEHRFLHILISILMGFLVGAIFLVIMGLSVGEAYGRLISSVTSLKGFSYVSPHPSGISVTVASSEKSSLIPHSR